MNKKVIIFDFDGTIANTLPSIVRIIRKLLKESGYKRFRNQDLEKFRHKGIQEAAKEFGVPLIKLPFIIKKIQKELNKEINNLSVFPQMAEVIKTLKKRQYLLGILSVNSKENIKKFLKKHRLEIFDFIFSAKIVFGKEKVLRQLLKTQNFKANEVVYIGDEVGDIEAARKNQVRIISVTWGFNAKEMLGKMQPDYLVDQPSKILKILKKIK